MALSGSSNWDVANGRFDFVKFIYLELSDNLSKNANVFFEWNSVV